MSNERLAAQAAATLEGALPDGIHTVELTHVDVVERKKGGYWLRLIGKTAGGRSARQLRRLGGDDSPFDLSAGQWKGLREFTGRLGAVVADTPQGCVDRIAGLVGESLQVKVHRGPTGPVCTFGGDTGVAFGNYQKALTVEGEVIELRPEDVRDPVEVAQEAHELLRRGLTASRLALTAAAKACFDIRNGKLWASLSFATLDEYLASPEISMKRTEFHRLASIWHRYIVEGGLDPDQLSAASVTKLEVPLAALSAGKVSAEDALADATALARRDLRVKYAGDQESTPLVQRCKCCRDIPVEVLQLIGTIPLPQLVALLQPYAKAA